MKKIATSIFWFLFLLFVIKIFAATSGTTNANWKDLLLKVTNFIVLVSLIWFFFGKKIILVLKNAVQSDYDIFFTVLKKKQELTNKLQELLVNIEKEKIRHQQVETAYFGEIDLEKDRVQKESEAYCQKLNKNNAIILDQEYKAAKQLLCKRIFYKALEKLEQDIRNKTISIAQEKYLTNFVNKVQQIKR